MFHTVNILLVNWYTVYMNRRVLLLILDGWGIAPAGHGNAISRANTPNFDFLWSKYPHTKLAAAGEAVGLPHGQIGNSEVGHLNIGAGRTVLQDLPRISKSVSDGDFFHNKVLKGIFDYVKKNNKPLHLIGLISPGGVHSHQEHLYAILEMAKHEGVHDIYIHAITDGRDVAPKSAETYITKLEKKLKEIGVGHIATVSGRYYSMDRDHRWERTALAYKAMVEGKGELYQTSLEAIEKAYKRGITDEFLRPSVIDSNGLINSGDGIFFFNLRSDRPRQLSEALLNEKFAGFNREKKLKNLYFVTMTEYEKSLPVNGIVFEPVEVKNCLAKTLSDHEIKQFHLAETEKYAHVTYYFDGGVEKSLPLEEKLMIASPKVSTYDKKPEMSAEKIATELTERLGRYDFIVVNFANLDMVGHTGMIPETIKAVETVDACLGGVVSAARNLGYEIIITADHGNAEKMINGDGSPCTAHTTNPVPLIIVSDEEYQIRESQGCSLGNIAPTILELLRVPKPKEMCASSLIEKVRNYV